MPLLCRRLRLATQRAGFPGDETETVQVLQVPGVLQRGEGMRSGEQSRRRGSTYAMRRVGQGDLAMYNANVRDEWQQ